MQKTNIHMMEFYSVRKDRRRTVWEEERGTNGREDNRRVMG